MTRKEYIQLIHIARSKAVTCPACHKIRCRDQDNGPAVCSDCGIDMEPMDEDQYRRILSTVTGKTSSKDMDEEELAKVWQVFTTAGFKPRTGSSIDQVRADWKEGRRKTIGVIMSEAKRTLGPSWEHRLEKFVASKNNGETRLYKLSDASLRQVIGWLRRSAKTRQDQAKWPGLK